MRRPEGPVFQTFKGQTMGTHYTVKVLGAQEGLAALIQSGLEAVDARMSTYRSDSELSRFNQSSEQIFSASPQLIEVMEMAQTISGLSGGAFDITVGPLVNAWGFGPNKRQNPPDEAEIQKLLSRLGHQHLHIEREAGQLRKDLPELYCDLSAIAKGYGVDQLAELLLKEGYKNFMVEVGGELRVEGRNAEGKPWQIGIQLPSSEEQALQEVISISGIAMATSGDYRNYYEKGGERISHTIDARTGKPIKHRLASITVLHPRCALADAWATALNVLGPEEGFRLAERERLPAFFVIRDPEGHFIERATPAFKKIRDQDRTLQ